MRMCNNTCIPAISCGRAKRLSLQGEGLINWATPTSSCKGRGFLTTPLVIHTLYHVYVVPSVGALPWFSKHRPSGPMLSISRNDHMFVCLFVCVCVCLSVCLFTFEVPLNSLFAPTSQSRMSNIFRDSESLGKSNGKKWSHIWTFLFESGLKSPRKKKFFCADFALQNMLETTLPDGLETSGRWPYC